MNSQAPRSEVKDAMGKAPGMAPGNTTHVLIVGGGYVGMYTALRLQRKLRRDLKRGVVEITVIDPQSYMTYQPFLPEAAAGNLEPRHVVAPLRQVLPKVRILNGQVIAVDHARHRVSVRLAGAELTEDGTRELGYDLLVMAAGSISRTLPIPGLAERGIGFKTVAEAIYLRNHVLGQLDIAASTEDAALKRRALTFVFVGGGYAGVEALAELEDMACGALKYYPGLRSEDMRWVLVEATDHILPEVGPDMGRWTVEALRRRRIEVKLDTLLKSAVDGHIELSDGDSFDAGTLVWTAGVKPHPVVRPGDLCTPNAQHAVRQAKRLADNIVATLRGRPLRPYRHAYAGSVASLGLHKGVAQVYGVKVRGRLAWFLHRTYHLSRIPTFNRKVRVLLDWTLALFFRREIVSLGALQRPREQFVLAASEGTSARTDRSRPDRQ